MDTGGVLRNWALGTQGGAARAGQLQLSQAAARCTVYCSCVRTNHATNYYCYVGARMCGEMLCPVLVCSVTKHRGYHIVNIVSSVTEYNNDIRCSAVMHCNISQSISMFWRRNIKHKHIIMSHYDLINGGLFSVASPRVAACGARQIARISMKFLVVV